MSLEPVSGKYRAENGNANLKCKNPENQANATDLKPEVEFRFPSLWATIFPIMPWLDFPTQWLIKHLWHMKQPLINKVGTWRCAVKPTAPWLIQRHIFSQSIDQAVARDISPGNHGAFSAWVLTLLWVLSRLHWKRFIKCREMSSVCCDLGGLEY